MISISWRLANSVSRTTLITVTHERDDEQDRQDKSRRCARRSTTRDQPIQPAPVITHVADAVHRPQPFGQASRSAASCARSGRMRTSYDAGSGFVGQRTGRGRQIRKLRAESAQRFRLRHERVPVHETARAERALDGCAVFARRAVGQVNRQLRRRAPPLDDARGIAAREQEQTQHKQAD